MTLGIVTGILFVTPLVLSYLAVVRWADRFDPVSWWLLLLCFVWGAGLATVGAGFATGWAERTLLPPNPSIQFAVGAAVFAPIFEESFKATCLFAIALGSVAGLRELEGPLDGALCGGVIGLGFTLTEDVSYVARQYAESGFGGFLLLLFVRTVILGLSHCTFTACTGLGFGIAAASKRPWVRLLGPIVGFGCGVVMHSVHNALTFFGESGLALMIVVSWAIDVLFFALIAVLVARDRAVVLRELYGEVGELVSPRELRHVSSYFTLTLSNMKVLFERGFSYYRERRRKQLQLLELAFLKSRRRRGFSDGGLDARELRLRQAITEANMRGISVCADNAR